MGADLHKTRVLETILPAATSRKLVLLTGARQTGKTTLAKTKYAHLNYINLDAPENREVVRGISSAGWRQSMGDAVIDEAQKEPEIFDKIKYAFDERSISFSVLLGSSQILLLKKIRESLSGRVSIYEIWPLMMCELFWREDRAESTPPLIDRLIGEGVLGKVLGQLPERLLGEIDARCREAENHLLRWGGMPALLHLPEEERGKWLKDYEYTYLERDLGDLARLSDLMPFRTFQKLSALRSAQLLNYSELGRDAALSADTARRYMQYLSLSYQTILLQPYYENLTSSVVKTPKIYWLDVGLLRQLSGMQSDLSGAIYETMVVGEIIKWLKTVQNDSEVYYYRTRTGMEIDILLRTPHGIIGMEIKNRKTYSGSDVRSMRDVAAALGNKWRGGLLVYRGESLKKIAEPDIWVIPSRRLFT
jgi:uncharacterized protein